MIDQPRSCNDRARAARRLFAGALALTLACGPTPASAADPFGELMQRFAARPHGHAAFYESQSVSVLKHPLESSGELFFEAPDHLEKRTLLPKPESLIVDRGMLTIQRGTRKFSVALRAYPQIGPFIDSIRATLAGERASLEAIYGIDFAAAEHGWVLQLTPRDAKLAGIIRNIRISGADDQIHSVETVRVDGDRSLMTVTLLPGQ